MLTFLEGFSAVYYSEMSLLKASPSRFCSRIIPGWLRIFRFIVEYVREPEVESSRHHDTDKPCLPMIIGGGLIMAWAYNRAKSAVHQ